MIKTIRLDLLDLFGSGYVIDHCISALSESAKILKYQMYVTDCLKNINEIFAKRCGGTYASIRFVEIINDNKKAEDIKTGDEIAMDIIKRAGLKSKQKGGENNGFADTNGNIGT